MPRKRTLSPLVETQMGELADAKAEISPNIVVTWTGVAMPAVAPAVTMMNDA